MARDVVERLRELRPTEASLMANTVVVGLQDLDALIAVVEAAENLGTCPFCGRRNRSVNFKPIKQPHAETCVLARLYAGASGES